MNTPEQVTSATIAVTLVTKADGVMSKSIYLNGTGLPHNDSRQCALETGTAQTLHLSSLDDLAVLLNNLTSHQAITLGVVSCDPLGGAVWPVVTKAQVATMPPGSCITRSQDHIGYRSGQPGFMLVDFDQKGMPDHVSKSLASPGVVDAILNEIQGGFEVGHVYRNSTSSGLWHGQTGETYPDSGGFHLYLPVLDSNDIDRALKVLHQRMFLAGYGWHLVGKRGALLERSVVDRAVGTPERLIFEGAPIVAEPLMQDAASREATVYSGAGLLDTRIALPDLTDEEQASFDDLVRASRDRMAGASQAARDAFVSDEAKRTGRTTDAIRADLAMADKGVLAVDHILYFDDPQIGQKTVGEVMRDLGSYHEKSLGDPMDPDDGRGKAMVFNSGLINSYAHGGAVYKMAMPPDLVGQVFMTAGGPEKGQIPNTTPVPVVQTARSVVEGEYVMVDGKLRWCLATAVAILEVHDDWADVLAFNDFTGEIVICKPVPSSDGRTFQPHHMTDLDVAHAEAWFNRIGFHNAKETIIRRAMVKAAHQNVIDPVRHYLEDLRWDGVPRLNKWLTTHAGAADNLYTNEVGRCMLVGAVARVLNPGCKMDTMPILEGRQGIHKSQMLRVLAGDEYFGDSLPPLKDKDAADYLAGLWFVEMAELDMMNRATMETTKSFLARQDDRFRPAYTRDKIKRPRRCIFIGTTNQDNYLRDETGNRRFWPVQVTKIDLVALRKDRDQLWAEAVASYSDNPKWWLSGVVEQLAVVEQKKRNEDDPWTSDVLGYVEKKNEISIKEILKFAGIVAKGDLTRGDSNRVAGILKAHGWERAGLVTSGTFKSAAKYVRR